MPKLMVVTCHTPSLFWFRLDMMKHFIQNGYDIVAVGNEEETQWNELFSKENIKYKKALIDRNGKNPFKDIKTYKSLVSIMREEKPDAVFLYNAKAVIYGSLAAKKLSIDCVSLIAGLGSVFLSTGFKNALVKRILISEYKKSLKCCRKVLFQNEDDVSLFLNKKLVKKEQIEMINGSGVNLSVFKEKPLPNENHFLFIGRLIKDKGIVEFLEAAKQVKAKYPSTVFSVVGPFDSNPSSITEEMLEPFISNNVINFYGEQRNVVPFLEKCSAFVLPSYREGTPKTVLEAMAVGRPIITTDAPGCRQTVVNGKNGVLVPIKNIPKLVEAMEELLSNKEKCLEMGKQSRLLAEKTYDVNIINVKILNVFQKKGDNL